MIKFFTILLFLFSCKASNELTFVATASRNVIAAIDSAKFSTGNEAAVKRYLVEYGTDTLHYTTIGTITPGKNSYTYPVPDQYNGWIRIHSIGDTEFVTKPVLHKTNSVTITSAIYSTTSLKWTVSAEKNVSSYLIEKSADNKIWSKTTQVTDKGNGAYTYRYSKTTKKYTYRLTVIFKDGTKSTSTTFK